MGVRTLPKPILATIVLTLAALMVVLPTAAYAATSVGAEAPAPLACAPGDMRDACSDAQAQADTDHNGTLWFVGGCLATVLTLLAAQLIEPEPPASALLGQDPTYVANYTDCYEDATKRKRTRSALTGCLVGGAVYAALWAVVLIADASTN